MRRIFILIKNKYRLFLAFGFVVVLMTMAFIGLNDYRLNKSKNEVTYTNQEEKTNVNTEIFNDNISQNNPASKKIEISGVVVNNFEPEIQSENEKASIVLKSEDGYSIEYLKKFDSFLISITSSPFAANRKKAEENFLGILDVSKENACQLNTTLSTPGYVNPNEAGKIYKLSFCE